MSASAFFFHFVGWMSFLSGSTITRNCRLSFVFIGMMMISLSQGEYTGARSRSGGRKASFVRLAEDGEVLMRGPQRGLKLSPALYKEASAALTV